MLKKRTDVLIADLLKIMSCKIICMHWKKKKKRKNRIIGVFLASLLLYVFFVLFVLPTYLR